MKTKEKIINALQELPDEASLEDAMERLLDGAVAVSLEGRKRTIPS